MSFKSLETSFEANKKIHPCSGEGGKFFAAALDEQPTIGPITNGPARFQHRQFEISCVFKIGFKRRCSIFALLNVVHKLRGCNPLLGINVINGSL